MRRPRQRCPRDWKGKPLYFADEPYDFRVVDADNDDAVPLDPTNCAYVCAWRRLGYTAEVGRAFTNIDFGRFAVKFRTTAIMQRQLTANDQGGSIFPGDYRLGAISPSGRQPRVQGKNSGAGGGNPPKMPVGPDLVRRRLAS
ncbi:MAG TPA: hypothetical protein VLL25_17350 [Acidimicrobiales bacterium]|nr:hypothetical protein [Acidimicrobiales bacterium]